MLTQSDMFASSLTLTARVRRVDFGVKVVPVRRDQAVYEIDGVTYSMPFREMDVFKMLCSALYTSDPIVTDEQICPESPTGSHELIRRLRRRLRFASEGWIDIQTVPHGYVLDLHGGTVAMGKE